MASNVRVPCRLGCGQSLKTAIYEKKHVREGRCPLSTLATTGPYSREEWDWIRKNLGTTGSWWYCPWCQNRAKNADTSFSHMVEKDCSVAQWHAMKQCQGLDMPSTLAAAAFGPVFPPLGPPCRIKPSHRMWAGIPNSTTTMSTTATPAAPANTPAAVVSLTSVTASASASVAVILPPAPTPSPPTAPARIPASSSTRTQPPFRKRKRAGDDESDYDGDDDDTGSSAYVPPTTRGSKRSRPARGQSGTIPAMATTNNNPSASVSTLTATAPPQPASVSVVAPAPVRFGGHLPRCWLEVCQTRAEADGWVSEIPSATIRT